MLTETLLRQFKYCNEVGCYPVLALVGAEPQTWGSANLKREFIDRLKARSGRLLILDSFLPTCHHRKELYGIVLHKATSHQRRKIELNTNARLPDWVLPLLRTNEVIVLLSRKVACWNHSKDVKAITPDPTPGHWENILKDRLRTLVKQKKGNEGKRGIGMLLV
ncbi:hypothetical protein F5880DRAFT_1507802 [Lentinula raphanica]|nr:hypothetical protein F5880DRAFT_1507802 [Lentinula raphanica]